MTQKPVNRQPQSGEAMSAAIERATATLARSEARGLDLLDCAVRSLVEGLDCRAATFLRLTADGKMAETLAFRGRGRRLKGQMFELRGRLRAVLADGQAKSGYRFEAGALASDPELPDCFRRLGACGYRSELILDAAGRPVALMLAILQGGERDATRKRDFFRLVSRLAGAEYLSTLSESESVDDVSRPRQGDPRSVSDHEPDLADLDRSLIATLVDSANLAIIGRKMDGTIFSWNEAAERIFGYSAEEVIGRNISIVSPLGLGTDWQDINEKLFEANQIVSCEIQRLRKDGTTINMRSYLSPIKDAAGSTVALYSICQDVSAIRRLERALERNLTLLQCAQSIGSMGFWTWQAGGGNIKLSGEARRVLGLAPEDGSFATLADYVARFVHADDRSRVGDLLGRLSPEQSVVSDSHRIVQWDGRIRSIELWVEAEFDHAGELHSMNGVLHDSTEVELFREALVASEARFRDFAEVASDWVWETGSDGRIRHVSDRISEVTGFPASHYIGKTWAECLIEPDGISLSHYESEVAARRSFRDLLFKIQTRDGRESWISLSGKPQYEAGLHYQGYRGAGSDATVRKRAEGELRQAMETAEKATEIKSRFLAAASHDLRQPLHATRLLVNSLMSSRSDADRTVITKEISRGLRSMADILNALLDVSELDAGRVQPEIVTFDMGQLFETLAVTAASRATEKGLSFRYVPTSAMVRSDPGLLARVVENFLSNAIRHTESGRVLLGCRRRGEGLRIEVLDSGPGIPADQQELIFEEYLQLDEHGSGDRGLGLGLAIVRRMSELLEHPVEVHSRLGAGSRFVVEVPLDLSRSSSRDASSEADPGAVDLQGSTVLLIEDDIAVRKATRRLLREAGAKVVETGGSGETMRHVARLKQPPDLIMADLNLSGGLLGHQVVEKIRAHFGYLIPAIILTGETRSEQLNAVARSGLPLLRKPANPQAIWSTISELLRLGAAAE